MIRPYASAGPLQAGSGQANAGEPPKRVLGASMCVSWLINQPVTRVR